MDLSGELFETKSKKFNIGDKVLATGFGLGETLNGSFSEYVYLPSSMVIKLPKKLSLMDSMKLGTAGFTVALAIEKLKQNKQEKISGPFAVTGSTGGVGSFAINILSQLGYEIHAITRKHSSEEYLKKIGASKVINLNKIKSEKKINTIHTETISMNEILKYSNKIISGNSRGRILIKIR